MTTSATPSVESSVEQVLPDSTPLIDRPEELRERFARDGVLYFRQAVDPEAIAAVRAEYISHLKELGLVDADSADPIWNGVKEVDGKLATKVDDSVWQNLVHHPSFDRAIRAFQGATPAWIPIVVHRSSPPVGPASDDIYVGRHQDGVFNFGVTFITCWVPLMDIDDEIGGLAVVPGVHHQSFYDFEPGEIPARAGGIEAGRISDDRWRRPDYKVGDILMFHDMTPHAGLPNSSDRFRLSVDLRFVPQGPEPLVGRVERFDGSSIELVGETGTRHIAVDDRTVVRGPKGGRLLGDEMSAVLFEGADILAVPDDDGHAKLLRSVSRKYVDVPPAWFTELPVNWVN